MVRLFICILTSINSVNCSDNKTKSSDVELVLNVNDSAFKLWLKDTVSFIVNRLDKEKKRNEGLINYEINISEDSLSMELKKGFQVRINAKKLPQRRLSNMVLNVQNLLNEYGELPKGQFNLEFKTLDYYYPSSSRAIIYDDLFEISEIKIKTGNTISEYTYIRGRLGSVKTTKFLKGNAIEVNYFDFIWDGNKLKKKEV